MISSGKLVVRRSLAIESWKNPRPPRHAGNSIVSTPASGHGALHGGIASCTVMCCMAVPWIDTLSLGQSPLSSPVFTDLPYATLQKSSGPFTRSMLSASQRRNEAVIKRPRITAEDHLSQHSSVPEKSRKISRTSSSVHSRQLGSTSSLRKHLYTREGRGWRSRRPFLPERNKANARNSESVDIDPWSSISEKTHSTMASSKTHGGSGLSRKTDNKSKKTTVPCDIELGDQTIMDEFPPLTLVSYRSYGSRPRAAPCDIIELADNKTETVITITLRSTSNLHYHSIRVTISMDGSMNLTVGSSPVFHILRGGFPHLRLLTRLLLHQNVRCAPFMSDEPNLYPKLRTGQRITHVGCTGTSSAEGGTSE